MNMAAETNRLLHIMARAQSKTAEVLEHPAAESCGESENKIKDTMKNPEKSIPECKYRVGFHDAPRQFNKPVEDCTYGDVRGDSCSSHYPVQLHYCQMWAESFVACPECGSNQTWWCAETDDLWCPDCNTETSLEGLDV